MISVNEAKKIISENIIVLPAQESELQLAVGMVLAEDTYATVDIPLFPQSSMDGYAISHSGWLKHEKLMLSGEMAAGSASEMIIEPDRAVRIFTGAAVPVGADTVVMQEKTRIDYGALIIEDKALTKGTNVRNRGSEIIAGALALEKDQLLTPAAIGFLANIGIAAVRVYAKPSVTIIVTGNELQEPGKKLEFGQVFESNSFTLRAALQNINITNIRTVKATDDLKMLTDILSLALEETDVVLLTGGVSVGDYDFVLRAAAQCGVKTLFHKVKQRPGKPLYFGSRDNKIVFGLPGNPSSVLTCFYEYALPALEQMMNRKTSLKVIQAPIGKTFKKIVPLTFFLKGYFDGSTAFPMDAQESYRMSSFARSNCLIRIEEEEIEHLEGEPVEVHLFSFNH